MSKRNNTLMNSESLDPRSLSMACLVARLQPRGPGVKSFLSGERWRVHCLELAFSIIHLFVWECHLFIRIFLYENVLFLGWKLYILKSSLVKTDTIVNTCVFWIFRCTLVSTVVTRSVRVRVPKLAHMHTLLLLNVRRNILDYFWFTYLCVTRNFGWFLINSSFISD